ncbi:hypothetical protein [Haliangium sp.]|uniref:hypothetical protein n=1 Tax=Haliangium sp. TaxID=2663208 RepID=UPI003D0E0BA2
MGISLLSLAACGPRVAPTGPGPEPGGPEASAARGPAGAAPGRSAVAPMREVLVGEMCPRGAAGRPAVKPLFVRGLRWSEAGEDVRLPIERRSARQFSVLAWDGRRAGLFSVAGLAELDDDTAVAAGAYAGDSPCARASDPDEGGAGSGDDPACVEAMSHCGVAVAVLEPSGPGASPFDEEPEPTEVWSAGAAGACVIDGKLLVDIDADGTAEAFPVADLVNPVRAPAEEVLATNLDGAACRPSFSIHHAVPPGDPRHWRGLDILGVIDLDGDGRRELIAAYHYATRRTWAVYSARGTAARLDLVGEAEPWTTR